jgi:tetratricopeptide (TPR) repeat protein
MFGAALTVVALLAFFIWQFMLRTDDLLPSKEQQDLTVTSTALSNNPWQGKDLYCEAERLYHLQQYPAALAGFQEATQFAGVRAKSWYNIGCIRIKMSQLDLALAALQQSVEFGYADENHYQTDPDLEELRRDPRYLTLLSRIREVAQANELAAAAQNEVSQGNLAVAEQHCRAALALQPIHGEAATQLGYVLHLQGRIDEAVPWHQVAAQSEDSQAMGNYNLACYFALKRQNSLALEHLNRAIRLGLSRCLSVQRVKQDSDLREIINTPQFSAAIVAMEQYDQQLRQGLDPDLVEAYRAVGLDPTVHRAQIFQGLSATCVRDYQAGGLDLKKYNTMLQNRVPYSLIERYQRAGLDPLEHESSLLQRREPNEIKSTDQSLELD